MLNSKEIFEQYDKESKHYLTKHELKLSLIYVLGYKLRYDQLKKIWLNRFEYQPFQKHDKSLINQGITFEYFDYIKQKIESQVNKEKRILTDFKSIIKDDGDEKLDFQKFNDILDESGVKFLNEAKKLEIFNILDLDKDEQISFPDFSNSFKLSCIDIQ